MSLKMHHLPLTVLVALIPLGCLPSPVMPGNQPAPDRTTQPSPTSTQSPSGSAALPTAKPSAPPTDFKIPEPQYGPRLDIPGEPAAWFRLQPEAVEADKPMSDLLSANAPNVTYDPALAKAGRAYLDYALTHEKFDSDGLIGFLAGWAGAMGFNGYYLHYWSGVDSTVEMGKFLKSTFGSKGPEQHLGLAKVSKDGMDRWIAVMGKGNDWLLGDFPRAAAANSVATLKFKLPAGRTDFEAIVAPDSGPIRHVPVTVSGGTGEAQIAFGPAAGPQQVEILSNGQWGHGVDYLFTVYAGQAPTYFQPELSADESAVKTVEDAERLAVDLINIDRAKHQLPPLLFDPALRDIARAHSEDMTKTGIIAHVSPNTGSPSDRYKAAGYNASALYENIGLASSVHGAQAWLMSSPGHREALLSSAVTRVGAGIVLKRDDKGAITQCLMTQNFAEPQGS